MKFIKYDDTQGILDFLFNFERAKPEISNMESLLYKLVNGNVLENKSITIWLYHTTLL